ncbi:hypothetical protein HIM_03535 [Hirsutella minnesotensis 3608]|uniref:GPI anchored cell wall protein n=1 Tax=Hirsutella minnesotensis 3608 TaxID=1043627 RepID=A0A0F8A6K0_9HYPO|nr:hypothetical protein HIM_03535 [Hirsutella minnesotensis 3608]
MARSVALVALLAGAAFAASSVPTPVSTQPPNPSDDVMTFDGGLVASFVGTEAGATTMVIKCGPAASANCPLPSPATVIQSDDTLRTSFNTPIVEDGENLGTAKADVKCKIDGEASNAKCDIDIKGEKDGKVFYTYSGHRTVSDANGILGLATALSDASASPSGSRTLSLPSSTGASVASSTATASSSKTSASESSSNKASASSNVAATGSTSSTSSSASPTATSAAGSIAPHNAMLAGIAAVLGYMAM